MQHLLWKSGSWHTELTPREGDYEAVRKHFLSDLAALQPESRSHKRACQTLRTMSEETLACSADLFYTQKLALGAQDNYRWPQGHILHVKGLSRGQCARPNPQAAASCVRVSRSEFCPPRLLWRSADGHPGKKQIMAQVLGLLLLMWTSGK